MEIVSNVYHINNLMKLEHHVIPSVLEDKCIHQTGNIVSIAQHTHEHLILTPFVIKDALLTISF